MKPELVSFGLSGGTITAVTVAFIGALATTLVGVLNYQRQAQTQELMRSGQLTDRFAKAIDQLGSSNRSVRIGGVFALERIARESEIDRAHIIVALADFIRDQLPSSGAPESSTLTSYVQVLSTRAPDAQAALTVLTRSPLCDERITSKDDRLLDLSRTDLRRARLFKANLQYVNLYGTHLEGADLRGAHLEGANLRGARLGKFMEGNPNYQKGADLSDANLTGAKLDAGIEQAVTENTIGFP